MDAHSDTGTNLYRAGVLVLLTGVLVALGWLSFASLQFSDDTPDELYVVNTPIQIVEEQITVNASSVTAITERCLTRDVDVLFDFRIIWVSEDNRFIPGPTQILERTRPAGGAGCEGSTDPPIVSEVSLPEGGLPPGRWRFTSEMVLREPETLEELDRELTASEFFEVVEDG